MACSDQYYSCRPLSVEEDRVILMEKQLGSMSNTNIVYAITSKYESDSDRLSYARSLSTTLKTVLDDQFSHLFVVNHPPGYMTRLDINIEVPVHTDVERLKMGPNARNRVQIYLNQKHQRVDIHFSHMVMDGKTVMDILTRVAQKRYLGGRLPLLFNPKLGGFDVSSNTCNTPKSWAEFYYKKRLLVECEKRNIDWRSYRHPKQSIIDSWFYRVDQNGPLVLKDTLTLEEKPRTLHRKLLKDGPGASQPSFRILSKYTSLFDVVDTLINEKLIQSRSTVLSSNLIPFRHDYDTCSVKIQEHDIACIRQSMFQSKQRSLSDAQCLTAVALYGLNKSLNSKSILKSIIEKHVARQVPNGYVVKNILYQRSGNSELESTFLDEKRNQFLDPDFSISPSPECPGAIVFNNLIGFESWNLDLESMIKRRVPTVREGEWEPGETYPYVFFVTIKKDQGEYEVIFSHAKEGADKDKIKSEESEAILPSYDSQHVMKEACEAINHKLRSLKSRATQYDRTCKSMAVTALSVVSLGAVAAMAKVTP